jgi:peptidylprolyl isomerase
MYTGVGQVSKEQFDTSWDTGQPIVFPLSGVIKGWQEGLKGMRVNGRRQLVIPGALAYGNAGRPPASGSNETLVFVIDLVGVERPETNEG